jgi:hypothetical protein
MAEKDIIGCGHESVVDAAIKAGEVYLRSVEQQKSENLTVFTQGKNGEVKMDIMPHDQSNKPSK